MVSILCSAPREVERLSLASCKELAEVDAVDLVPRRVLLLQDDREYLHDGNCITP